MQEDGEGIIPYGTIIADRFSTRRKLGSGSFGDIYEAWDEESDHPVAIKFERRDSPHALLKFEYNVYRRLRNVVGIPYVWCYREDAYQRCIATRHAAAYELSYSSGASPAAEAEMEGDHHEPPVPVILYNAMVMELMGKSLEGLFRDFRKRFSLKTVLMLADQMLTRVEAFHESDFVHRDIKPENFMMGVRENAPVVYLIDFGLAKRYRHYPNTGKTGKTLQDEELSTHIPYTTNKRLTGTPRYASVNTHAGVEQSRRDDLESLGYVVMYFLRGNLPWQGVTADNKDEKYERIRDIKARTSIAELCRDFPTEFMLYFDYCRHLYFEDRPDYLYLRRLFRRLFRRCGYRWDYVYDWDVPPSTTATHSCQSRKAQHKKKLEAIANSA